MAGYFLDTSALAKLYHLEAGTAFVEAILRRPGAKAVISRVALVEIESVLARKVRSGVIEESNRLLSQKRLSADISSTRLLVGPPVEPRHFSSAARLIRLHGVSLGLRSLDALQLAVALEMKELGWISTVVSADRRLCAIAIQCGCPSIDPADQPSIHL